VYDPFAPGPHRVSSRTFEARDVRRGQSFPCDVWRPADADDGDDEDDAGVIRPRVAVVYSHYSGGNRRVATFLTTHLASHGYVVAALDHSEVVSAQLQRREGDTAEEREARVQRWIDNRVPDIALLLDAVLPAETGGSRPVGIVGHSFGGWTALAAADADERIGAVVALAPAGSAIRRTGIIPVRASFRADRAVPTLFVGGDQDQSIPIEAVRDLFDESPWPTRLLVLRGADHLHYVDDIAAGHEAFRQLPAEGDFAWIADMRPIEELCDPTAAQAVVRAVTLAHFDAVLRGVEVADAFLDADLSAALAARDIDAVVDSVP
jgi:predicted dienelactone hydrolase